MKKFLVRLIFRVHRGPGKKQASFESQFRIIHAENEAQAWLKARDSGLSEEGEVAPDYGGLIRWEFAGIELLLDLGEYEDGSLLFSSTQKKSDPDSYLNYLKAKMNSKKFPANPIFTSSPYTHAQASR
jgi:hypothetical protein